MPTTIFLPGASGDAEFWRPVAERVGSSDDCTLLGWPGFYGTAPDPAVTRLSDLASLVRQHLTEPSILVAQSMGGVVAVLTALASKHLVRKLVLTATSGGVDMERHGASDWRPGYLKRATSETPRWFVDDRTDVTDALATLDVETLLIFGDRDPIAPVSVGQFLASLIPHSQLVVIEGGGHDMAVRHSDEVARHIAAFIE